MTSHPQFPRGYTSDEDAAAIYDDMLPGGGIGPGTLVAKYRAAGGAGNAKPAAETFAGFLAKQRDTGLDDADPIAVGEWSFGLYDAEADAGLAPIVYRDALKFWPDSPGRTVSQVIAAPKHHKTNWIMAEKFRLMLHASAKVLMLALEGAYGVRTMRLKALASHYNVPLADLRGRFQIVEIKSGGMFDMSDPACVIAFADFVKAGGWTDVFIDTQHRSAGALEENSATDARLFWNAVEVLRRRGNVNVTLAHHTGKDATKGGRGSSADLASVDQQIVLEFDRATMTVAAKVTARKDGVDGFMAPFKVHQANENSVPILVPMAVDEYQSVTSSPDRATASAIASALAQLEIVGRAKACSTRVIAHQVLLQRDELPKDAEECERAVTNLQNRILERAKTDPRIQAYGRKDGGHKTAPWIWYLPDSASEGWSDV